MPAHSESSCLIVGGGVIGLSLAWELANRAVKVTVIESQAAHHRSASWAGAGILPPALQKNVVDPCDQLRTLSHRLHPLWARQLSQQTGIDTGFRRCGGIYLATTPAECATLTANQYWWDEHGIDYRRLEKRELLKLEPALTDSALENFLGAWLLPDECQIRNPRHLQALRQACEQLGVTMIGAEIERASIGADGLAKLHDQRGQVYWAKAICLCTGAWTRMLMEQTGLRNGIMPVRGQMLLYRAKAPLLEHIVNEGNRYLVSREDGFLLAGSVEEEAGYIMETTPEALDGIAQWATDRLPALRSCVIEKSWAGLRPGSYDGLPYMGRAPGASNLYIAAGHYRSGLHLSCGAAVVMADLILGIQPEIDIFPFRVARG